MEETAAAQEYGKQQQIKMELLGMIQSGENPFDIIYHLAQYLEEASDEAGYAKIIQDNLRSVYGFALQDKKLLADELAEVIARGKRIKESYEHGDFTAEEKQRIEYALLLHRKNAERLQSLIKKASQENTQPYLQKHPSA